MGKQIWAKGISTDKKVFNFTVGNDYKMDQELLPYDVLCSEAHAMMLHEIGILSKKELADILKALKELLKDYGQGKVKVKPQDEDMHNVIENYLVKKIGKTGKKIHTARSRNDQVLVALRLYYRDKTQVMSVLVEDLIENLKKFSKKYGQIEIPGYTHMRKAMPSSVKMWSEAYIESMQDNLKLLQFVGKLVDQNPLGTAAGYGAPIKVDRKITTQMLGFDKTQKSPIYAQNSRGKFESLTLSAMSQVMYDINKMASDLIMFSMPEFGFFDLPVEFCTGSSIMPQKKNPDVLELLRAKYHVIIAEEIKVKSMIGNLISGYNRDTQLIKESMVNTITMVLECTEIMALIFKKLKVDKKKAKEAMTSELYATAKAYELIAKGYTFRDAYNEIKKDLI